MDGEGDGNETLENGRGFANSTFMDSKSSSRLITMATDMSTNLSPIVSQHASGSDRTGLVRSPCSQLNSSSTLSRRSQEERPCKSLSMSLTLPHSNWIDDIDCRNSKTRMSKSSSSMSLEEEYHRTNSHVLVQDDALSPVTDKDKNAALACHGDEPNSSSYSNSKENANRAPRASTRSHNRSLPLISGAGTEIGTEGKKTKKGKRVTFSSLLSFHSEISRSHSHDDDSHSHSLDDDNDSKENSKGACGSGSNQNSVNSSILYGDQGHDGSAFKSKRKLKDRTETAKSLSSTNAPMESKRPKRQSTMNKEAKEVGGKPLAKSERFHGG